MHAQEFWEGPFGLRQAIEKEPLYLGLLAPGAGNDGDGRMPSAAIARTVGKAVVLAAEGEGAAALTAAVEIFALAINDRLRVVSAAKGLAGKSAAGAGLSFVERGAEAWHECLQQ